MVPFLGPESGPEIGTVGRWFVIKFIKADRIPVPKTGPESGPENRTGDGAE